MDTQSENNWNSSIRFCDLLSDSDYYVYILLAGTQMMTFCRWLPVAVNSSKHQDIVAFVILCDMRKRNPFSNEICPFHDNRHQTVIRYFWYIKGYYVDWCFHTTAVKLITEFYAIVCHIMKYSHSLLNDSPI